jgi:hypothetical protein
MIKKIPSIVSIRANSAQLTAVNISVNPMVERSGVLNVTSALLRRTKGSHRQVEHDGTAVSTSTFRILPMLDAIAVTEVTAHLPQYVSLTAIETPDMTTDIRNQAAITEALIKANHWNQIEPKIQRTHMIRR